MGFSEGEDMNVTELSERLGLEREEFIELAGLFLETSASDLISLQQAVERGIAQQAIGPAHSIKGAANNLGFEDIYEVAEKVEAKARNNILDGAEESIQSIRGKLSHIESIMGGEMAGFNC
jgi:HPt (histidine-containing phosphotransfer) domain-containing protein